MEPATHLLTGACLSRTGLNRHAAYATLAMVIGAELPDIDTLWSLRGPIAGFEHHRGITHTFVGIPFEAAAVVAFIYLLHRWRTSRQTESRKPLTAAPVRWGVLYLLTLLALLSHLFLDFTNNYGIRPFLPFNPHWYAASIVFIFDPLIFAVLLGAAVVPSIFRLVSSEVGSRRQPFAARGWAVAALLAILAIWTFREIQHGRAVQLAMAQNIAEPRPASAIENPSLPDSPPSPDPVPVYLQANRVLASPDPISPFRWFTVTDYGPLYQTAEVNTSAHTFDPDQATQPKLNPSPTSRAAEASRLGRAYLDWSPMPFITIDTSSSDEPGNKTVTFADPRFMGDTLLLHATGRIPLTGKVELNSHDQVVSQTLDGKAQH